MSSFGYPDDQDRAPPFGDVLQSQGLVAVPASPAVVTIGPLTVAAYTAIVLNAVVATNPITAVFTWTLEGAAAAASVTSTLGLPVGTKQARVQCQGHTLTSVTFSGVGGAATLSYALAGSNLSPFSSAIGVVPSAGVNRVAVLNIPNNASTAIAFDFLNWDNFGMVNLAGHPTRITCQLDGFYQLSSYVSWTGNAVGERVISLQTTGPVLGVRHAVDARLVLTAATCYHNISHSFMLQVGDYAEVYVYQNSGGNLDVTGAGVDTPALTLEWIGALGVGPGIP